MKLNEGKIVKYYFNKVKVKFDLPLFFFEFLFKVYQNRNMLFGKSGGQIDPRIKNVKKTFLFSSILIPEVSKYKLFRILFLNEIIL